MSDLIPDSIKKLKPYIPGEQRNEKSFIKLNTNENPYLPSPNVQDILSEINISEFSKYPDPNCIELRKVIAELHNCNINQIFIGNGSDEILSLCSRAFVEKKQIITYLNPSYSLYRTIADIQDIKTNEISLNNEFELNSINNIEGKLFYLANPNAPTGKIINRDLMLDLLNNFKGIILIDEAYADFSDINFMDLGLSHSNVLISRSLSKSYSLAGIRCGYCIGDKNLIQALFKIKDSYNINYITQEIARAAILDQDTMKANVQAIIEARKMTFDALSELGFNPIKSQGNFIWVNPLIISAKDLYEQLYQKNILVRFFNTSALKEYIRITIGTIPQMFKLIDTIKEIINGK